MKLLTPQQMNQIDEIAIKHLGIPGIVLMENAALQIAYKASSIVQDIEEPRITIIAGNGNNGGDAFAVTRHLLSMGFIVSTYSMDNIEKLSDDALINAKILLNMGLEIPQIYDEEGIIRLKRSCMESDLVIDGIFGTGLNRDIEGIWSDVIDAINNYSRFILSIDIASGVDGLTGEIRGNCIKADATVTFFLPKVGMMQYPGAAKLGELSVADIGIPYAIAEDIDAPIVLDENDVKRILPDRPADGHKGTFGNVLMIAGSVGMTGAAYLSALAAYRAGSGLVRLAVPASCVTPLSILIPEAIFTPIPENDITKMHKIIEGLIEVSDAVLVGPGLTATDATLQLLEAVINFCDKPLVLDADALNLISRNKFLLEKLRCEAIITPHPMEMSRLTDLSVDEIQSDRIGITKAFADEFGITVVLKGVGTVIAANDGRVVINTTGNQGMATAGSGDVLAGVITSLIGQGLPTFEAAAVGAYLHGQAGDVAAEKFGEASVMASDIAQSLSKRGHTL